MATTIKLPQKAPSIISQLPVKTPAPKASPTPVTPVTLTSTPAKTPTAATPVATSTPIKTPAPVQTAVQTAFSVGGSSAAPTPPASTGTGAQNSSDFYSAPSVTQEGVTTAENPSQFSTLATAQQLAAGLGGIVVDESISGSAQPTYNIIANGQNINAGLLETEIQKYGGNEQEALSILGFGTGDTGLSLVSNPASPSSVPVVDASANSQPTQAFSMIESLIGTSAQSNAAAQAQATAESTSSTSAGTTSTGTTSTGTTASDNSAASTTSAPASAATSTGGTGVDPATGLPYSLEQAIANFGAGTTAPAPLDTTATDQSGNPYAGLTISGAAPAESSSSSGMPTSLLAWALVGGLVILGIVFRTKIEDFVHKHF